MCSACLFVYINRNYFLGYEMSDLNPTEIHRKYQCKELDKAVAVGYLKSFIESSSNEDLRVRSVELLGEMNLEVDKFFEFYEHLVTSDLSEEIRLTAAKVIINNFLEEGENLLKWVFQHEQSIKCLLDILKSLQSSTNYKAEELISIFESTFDNRFSQFDFYKKEKMGIGHIERILGKVQPYLTDVMFYDDLDILSLDKLYNEIVELVEFEVLSKTVIVKIMQLFSNRYIDEAEAEHDYHECWLSYQKAKISSEYGLRYNPNDRELLFNLGVACNYLGLYNKGIRAFLCLYKVEKKLDKKKYRKLKKIKKQGGTIVEYGGSGSLDYLIQLYKKVGLYKKEKWAKQQNKKKKIKFRKLTTNL